MKPLRVFGEYTDYVKKKTPAVKQARLAVRLRRTHRPVKTRTKDAEELRMLLRAYQVRKQQYAARDVLSQTGPRTWVMRLPT